MSIQKKPVKVIKLSEPIVIGDSEAVSEVCFYRKVKGKDLRKMPEDPTIDFMMDLMAELCNLEPFYFDEMDVEDVFKCVEALTSFLPSSLVAGLPNLAR